MGTSLSKTQLLTELRNEQVAWEALLDEIGQAHMTQPEVAGGWSIKDIVAHLTGWRRRSVRRFQALLHHDPDFSPPWPPELREDDEINAWIYESNRDRPLAEVLSESREVFQQLLETLEAFSEEELQDLRRVLGLQEEPVSGRLFFAHFHEEHEPDMRAWLEKVKKEKRETRAAEVARVRSYLASQAMKRTPAQLVEALREAHQQFLTAAATVPDPLFCVAPGNEEWSAADVMGHMLIIAAIDESAIPGVIERGEQPSDINDLISPAPTDLTREQMLAELERLRERLIASVLQADPTAHLDILWSHNEFGHMNWREWLLFARVHTLDHTRQMQSIAQSVTPT